MFSDHVDVLVADLSAVEIDEDVLSASELGKALFASPAALVGYLSAQTWLRRRLAEYLDCEPAEIAFGEGEHGESVVMAPPTDLSFGLASSDGMGALVVGFRKAVGIDIAAADRLGWDPQVLVRTGALAQANSVSLGRSMRTVGLDGPTPVVYGSHEITDINLGNDFIAAVAAPLGSQLHVTIVVADEVPNHVSALEPFRDRLAAVGI